MTGPVRVAHVTTTPEFIAHFVWPEIQRLGARTAPIVFCAAGPDLATLAAKGLPSEAIPIRRKITPLADLRTLLVLSAALRRHRPDLLNSYVPKGGLLGQIAGALARVPARVHACHGLLYTPDMPAWRRRLFRLTDRLTNRLAHRTVYVSRADLEFSVRERLCDRAKARYVGGGIDLARFDPAAVPADLRVAVRHELGLPPDAAVVLSIGRYVTDKGYRELADAAATLRATRSDARFVWVAPVLAGEEGALPDDYITSRGLADIVMRLPYQDDVRRVYAAADVLAHPSYREGTSRVLVEAAAMGVPLVVSDIPGCREVVPDDGMAVFVPPRDAIALAAGLERALGDRAASAARAGRARDSVRDRFDADGVAERIWEVYEELLGRNVNRER